eukprot:1952033-Amphidinium_carterae.2
MGEALSDEAHMPQRGCKPLETSWTPFMSIDPRHTPIDGSLCHGLDSKSALVLNTTQLNSSWGLVDGVQYDRSCFIGACMRSCSCLHLWRTCFMHSVLSLMASPLLCHDMRGSCVPSPAKAPVTIWELAGMRGPPKKRDIAGEEWDTADLLNLKPVEESAATLILVSALGGVCLALQELQEEGRARTGWRAGWPYSDAEASARTFTLGRFFASPKSLRV